MTSHFGETAALLTAVFWTVTALSFESAGKRVGSLAVNLLRLLIGFVFLSIFTFFYRGMVFPVDASAHAWIWLVLSGLVGFLVGDLCLFRAFVDIGARISMLIMASVPPFTALMGWLILGEKLSYGEWTGMALTIAGISIVILERKPGEKQVKLNKPGLGVLLAFGGAIGQSVGLVLSKYGMEDYDAFGATQIRVLAGIAGFLLLFAVLHRWRPVGAAFADKKAMALINTGAFFGPFLGVSFSLLAVQYTETGVASTIMSIVPVLIIPPAVALFHERVTLREIIGAMAAVGGVGMMFLG